MFRNSCRIRTRFRHEYRKINHKPQSNTLLNQRQKLIHPSTPPKNTGNTGGKIEPQDKDSTRLQELSLMNNIFFGATRYEIHLDIKLDYTLSSTFQELSLTELETLHQLCEIERKQILLSLALAVLKIHHAGYLLSGNRLNFID